MPAPVGPHSIIPCVESCGVYVRPKRMKKEVGDALVKELHGPDAVAMENTGKGLCSPCRNRIAPRERDRSNEPFRQNTGDPSRVAHWSFDKDPEYLAAGLARFQQERERRAAARRARPVPMGQSMVRI